MGSAPSPQETTLAEVLRENGYATGGLSANGVLQGRADRASNGSRHSGSGFGQGFEYYEAKPPKKIAGIRAPALWEKTRADEVNRGAMEWLDRLPQSRRSPIFLYLHYMEPHIPYKPEESFLRQTLAGRELPNMRSVNYFAYHANNVTVRDSTLLDIEAAYDAEVMSADAALRSLFSQLEERNFLDDAIVVVTADHGEELKDHGLIGHGNTLYEELIRVPLLILLPGQSERVDVWDVVSLVDVAPTLFDWLQIERPDSFAGRSFRSDLLRQTSWWRALVGRIVGIAAREPRIAYSELLRSHARRLSPHERALVMDSKKVILGVGGESEFYDTRADPAEKNPGVLSEESRAALRRALAAMEEGVLRPAHEEAPQPDPATEEILRALGYADG
jgi:arylsulfatase A-like enzyme